MTERSIEHNTFVVEREVAASPQHVFTYFADQAKKEIWFGDPAFPATEWTMDFREGGREYNTGEFHGYVSTFDALYLDIVEASRIVLSYNMYVDGVKLSSSLQTTELQAVETAGGIHTRLVLTETGVYFDGHEDPALRAEGTAGIIAQLAAAAEASV